MTLVHLTAFLLACSTVVSQSPILPNCVQAKDVCQNNDNCRPVLMYINSTRLCGDSVDKCTVTDRESCGVAHRALLSSFQNCTCDEQVEATAECNWLYKWLFHHPCINTDTQAVIGPTQPSTRNSRTRGSQSQSTAQSVPAGPTGGYNGGESTCVQALYGCNSDQTCRIYLAEYIDACTPDMVTEACRKEECLASKHAFFSTVNDMLTHSLVFCYCADDDETCLVLREGLNPLCSHKEDPMPSCLDLVNRCNRDSSCRSRYENFIEQCREDDSVSTGCQGTYAACRAAFVGTLGTEVASSCYCNMDESDGLQQCEDFKTIFFDNQCVAKSAQAFYSDEIEVKLTTQPPIVVDPRGQRDCEISLSDQREQVLITPGSNFRIPQNEESCSKVCHCASTGDLMNCTRLPCIDVSLKCTHNGKHYGHNELFQDEHYGNCICFDGDVICSMSPGILHRNNHPCIGIGYSVKEENELVNYVNVNTIEKTVQNKLQQLINTNKTEVTCHLDLVGKEAGVWMAVVSKDVVPDQVTECDSQLVKLCEMINGRSTVIVTDVVLSTFKVATVQHHNKPLMVTSSKPSLYLRHDNYGYYYLLLLLLLYSVNNVLRR